MQTERGNPFHFHRRSRTVSHTSNSAPSYAAREALTHTPEHRPARARDVGASRPAGQRVTFSSISVTSAAIGERSERVRRHVREQRVALELVDHRDDPVVAPDPQVVALGDVVGEHHLGVGPDAGQHGEQHVALQRLRLVDDDEGVVQRAAADVGQRQHLEHAAVDAPRR